MYIIYIYVGEVMELEEYQLPLLEEISAINLLLMTLLKGNTLVYISPESMLTNLKFREMFRSDVYQHNLVCLAIDEAHCVEKW